MANKCSILKENLKNLNNIIKDYSKSYNTYINNKERVENYLYKKILHNKETIEDFKNLLDKRFEVKKELHQYEAELAKKRKVLEKVNNNPLLKFIIGSHYTKGLGNILTVRLTKEDETPFLASLVPYNSKDIIDKWTKKIIDIYGKVYNIPNYTESETFKKQTKALKLFYDKETDTYPIMDLVFGKFNDLPEKAKKVLKDYKDIYPFM